MYERKRFSELLNRYLNDQANAEEHAELMRLINEGGYDKTLKDSIDAMLLDAESDQDLNLEAARRIKKEIMEAAEENTKIVPLRPMAARLRWIAAAAAVFVTGILIGWSIVTKETPQHELAVMQEQEQEMDHAVFRGKQFVRLPDGSTVILNDSSVLTYSTKFGKVAREVTLVGEGYFDVKFNPSVPFQVVTGKVTTTVLGTAFNINAYPQDDEIKVSVTRGKVEVSDGRRSLGVITKNQQIAVKTATSEYVQTNLETKLAEQWKSQYIILDDVSFQEAIEILEEKYSVKITVINDELNKCRITATFLDGEDLRQMLTVVCGVVNATYEMHAGGVVEIRGRGCQVAEFDSNPNPK